MQSPGWRKQFLEIVGRPPEQLTATKPFDPESAKKSRIAELKVKAWLEARGWKVRHVAHIHSLRYDHDAQRGQEYQKVEVIYRWYWEKGNDTWPLVNSRGQKIWPPRIVRRHVMSPATHFYLVNEDMTRMLIFDKDVVMAEGVVKLVTTPKTKDEQMWHISDWHGDYEDL
jgi:hypothetical protein